MTRILKLPSFIFLKLILAYQRTLSFDHGPLCVFFPNGFCRFYPSCSQYGFESIERFGVCKGVRLILWRLFRCNPWSHGGIDPVPDHDKKHGT